MLHPSNPFAAAPSRAAKSGGNVPNLLRESYASSLPHSVSTTIPVERVELWLNSSCQDGTSCQDGASDRDSNDCTTSGKPQAARGQQPSDATVVALVAERKHGDQQGRLVLVAKQVAPQAPPELFTSSSSLQALSLSHSLGKERNCVTCADFRLPPAAHNAAAGCRGMHKSKCSTHVPTAAPN
jgi:hypothetical protein